MSASIPPTMPRPDATGPAGEPGAYPGADAFVDFLKVADSARLRVASARVFKTAPDPLVPGRTGYLISGPHPLVVSMCQQLAEAADAPLGGKSGHARFTNPVKDGNEWVALGWTFVEPGR